MTELTEKAEAPPLAHASDDEHVHGHAHRPETPTPFAARVAALESLLVEKGILTREAVDRVVETYQNDVGPMNGARVVARAWVDPAFKQRLLADAASAIRELGLSGLRGEHLVAVENRPGVHNVIVCTLCSCYPWAVLGLPPSWYKSPAYRSRVVIEPREVLRELGLDLDDAIRVDVWDSSAETRYMVVPERPGGTEDMTEDQLAALVSRDSMIGVARVRAPG
ncbi:MAG: nitrile hydratase subunit alpha [Acidimicrobiales bacterium]